MPMDPKLYQMLLETFKGELIEQHQIMVDALISLESLNSQQEIDEALTTLFRISHNLKGSAKSVAMDELANLAHQLEDRFSLWRENKSRPEKNAIDVCLKLADDMISVFESSQGLNSHHHDDEMMKVPAHRVERVNAKINELSLFQLHLSNWIKKTHDIFNQLNQLHDEGFDALKSIKKKTADVLKDADKFSGEFVRDLLVLQQEGRLMQLVPIEHLLVPMKRTVRQIAEQEGKVVDLVVDGGRVEIDKSIAESLKAPLQHLIRNAVAHGVEDVAVREKNNKPSTAKLLIHVSSHAGEIKLALSDDGQGIDLLRLKQIALDKKFYPQDYLDKLTDDEALHLVFHSGLSTAQQVSELSGRGVGLDAVWEDIKRLRGTIKIESVWGKGTCFTLTLPLTMASERGLFVRSKTSVYMLPTLSIQGVHEVHYGALKRIDNQWTVIINHVPIAVYGLCDLLGTGRHEIDPATSYAGILVGHHQTHIIILVDEVMDEHDVVVKPLPFPLNQLNDLSGVTLIERGELVFILDVDYLIEKSSSILSSQLTLKANAERLKPVSEALRVLVVDDALTTRTLAVNALRAAGYETMTAENGQKAWDLVQNNQFDCVVTDIEMPVMDGFELTQAIKSHEDLKRIPIIIVSSREAEQDRKRGLEAGASAYLVKKEFDTRTLIHRVASLL